MFKNRVGRLGYALVVVVLLFVIGRNVYRRTLNNRLAVAVREHNPAAVRKWLDWGADANVRVYPVIPDTLDKPALAWTLAAYNSLPPDQEEIACLLLQHGANVRVETERGKYYINYLYNACQCGSVRVVRCLLEHGANPQPPETSGSSPMEMAIGYRIDPASRTVMGDPIPETEKPSEAKRLQREVEGKRRLGVSRELARLLRQHGATMSAWQAISIDDVEALRANLNAGTPVEQRGEPVHFVNSEGKAGIAPSRTLLTAAAQEGSLACLNLLLERGANINAQSWYPASPLAGAIMGKHPEIARLLLRKGAEVNVESNDPIHLSSPPLVVACGSLPEFVPELIRRGADVKTSGSGALSAAIRARHPELVTLLLKQGASARGKAGYDAVFAAIAYQPELVPVFLAQGADARGAPSAQPDLISQAVRYGRTNLIVPLVRAGADLHSNKIYMSVESNSAQRPVHNMPLIEALGQEPQMTRVLLEQGADPNALNTQGITPLIAAAQTGKMEAARLLLAHGAKVNEKGKLRHTPLYFARRHKHAEVAALLQQVGGKEE